MLLDGSNSGEAGQVIFNPKGIAGGSTAMPFLRTSEHAPEFHLNHQHADVFSSTGTHAPIKVTTIQESGPGERPLYSSAAILTPFAQIVDTPWLDRENFSRLRRWVIPWPGRPSLMTLVPERRV